MQMPGNTAVCAVVRSPGKAVLLGVLCLLVGAFTFFFLHSRLLWGLSFDFVGLRVLERSRTQSDEKSWLLYPL